MRDLKQRTYPPRPVRRVMISKGFGRTRPPDIPNVRERVAQEEPFRLRSPLFERLFHDDSYGFRPGCSCHMALARVREIHRTGCRYVLDADISGFFDQIPHAVIMRGGSVTADGNILKLVERFLCAGVMQDGVVESATLGPSQGGVISPLLANVALNFLNWQQDELGLRFVRYVGQFEAVPLRRAFRYPLHWTARSNGAGNPHTGLMKGSKPPAKTRWEREPHSLTHFYGRQSAVFSRGR